MKAAPRGIATDAVCDARATRRKARLPPTANGAAPCACGALLGTYPGCLCGGGWCSVCDADTCQCPWAAAPFTPACPDHDPARMAVIAVIDRVLADPGEPVGLIVGEYSGVIQAAYAAVGINMLTADWRRSERPEGLHYRGDAREIAFRRRWRLLIAHPWCRDIARSSAATRDAKEQRGDVWRGLAGVLLWICAPADAVIVEQPIGLYEVYGSAPSQTVQPWMFGDGPQKTWRLFTSDNVPPLRATHVVAGRSTREHRAPVYDPVERERARSRTPPGIAAALAAQVIPGRLPPRRVPPPIYMVEVAKLAATYAAAGKPLPIAYDAAFVTPLGDAALEQHHGANAAQRVLTEGDGARADERIQSQDAGAPAAASGGEHRRVRFADQVSAGPAAPPPRKRTIGADGPISTAPSPSELRGPPLQLPPPPGATVLIPVVVGDGAPRVLIPAHGDAVIGCAHAEHVSRDAAVEWGQRQCDALGIPAKATLLAGEMGSAHADDEQRVRLVIVIVHHRSEAAATSGPGEASGDGLRWVAGSALAAGRARRFAMAALHRALLLREPTVELPSELVTGASGPRAPRQRRETPADAAAPTVAERAEAANLACEELHSALATQSGDPTWVGFARMMADRVETIAPADIPPELREARFDFARADIDLAARPFRHKPARLTTAGPAEAPRPQADPAWRPFWIEDILTERGLKALAKEFTKLQEWTADMIAGKDVAHARPSGVALGRDSFHEKAWGTVWDLREGPGNVVPLATDQPLFESHLDLDFISAVFADSPDKELFGMLRRGGAGVDFRDGMPHQVVVLPNLLSLFDGVDAVADEITSLAKRGWYGIFDWIPMIPFRAAPRGSVPRADGGPPRGIVDQNGPRKAGFVTRFSKEPVPALNPAAKAADWGKEPKPSTKEAAFNHAVLLRLGDVGKLPLFLLALDFKYMFQCAPHSPRARATRAVHATASRFPPATSHAHARCLATRHARARRLTEHIAREYPAHASVCDAAVNSSSRQHRSGRWGRSSPRGQQTGPSSSAGRWST